MRMNYKVIKNLSGLQEKQISNINNECADYSKHPNLSFHINCSIVSMYIFYILERISLEAPREYVYSGLSSGLTELFASSLPYCIFLIYLGPPNSLLFVPTTQISHVHPPLTTRQLNTAIQVNNMSA